MQLKKYKELFLLLLAVWGVIMGGFLLIDLFIVPIETGIPSYIGSFIDNGLKVIISVVLVVIFLYIWDRLTTFYYEHYKKKRIKAQKSLKSGKNS